MSPCLLVSLSVLVCAGCVKRAGVIFEPVQPPIVWPTSDTPRIRYVGQLQTEADLKPAVFFTQALGEAMFGKPAVRSMLAPYALCTDGAERLFIADRDAQVLHVMDMHRRAYAQWKPKSGFTQPVGIAFDGGAGRLYVADSVGGVVSVFDSAGKELGRVGESLLQRPCGLAVDPRSGRLFVADVALHQVLVFGRDCKLVARVGERGSKPGQFNYPISVAVDREGRLYVCDSLNFRVQQFDAGLQLIKTVGKQGDLPGYFGLPKGIAIDSRNNLYVVDAKFETVQMFDPDGRVLMDFGREGRNRGEFWLPAGIFIDPKDRIWVADSYNRRVQVFDFLAEVSP